MLLYTLLKLRVVSIRYKAKFLTIVWLICTFSCIAFSVSIANQFSLDLRTVPWLISFYYGGPLSGLVVTVFMILYGFYIDGIGAYTSAVFYIVMSILVFFVSRSYSTYSFNRKISHVMIIGAINVLILVIGAIFIFTLRFTLTLQHLFFVSLYVIAFIITLLLIVSMIESLEENEKLHLEVVKIEKQFMIGQLAASVAHEIRNPMTVVRGFMQLLFEAKDTIALNEQKNYIKIMTTELDRAEIIINDYLSIAKTQAEVTDRLNINEEITLISKTIAPFSSLNGVIVQTKLTDSIFVKGNKGKFHQVLINIIKNGIEATSPNGIISIHTSFQRNLAFINIIDNGVGMTKTQLHNLGKPFYSMKEKGTGLGLSVCYHIILEMGGEIQVESKIGEGTCFTIILPRI